MQNSSKRLLIPVLALVALCLTAGCATTKPTYQPTQKSTLDPELMKAASGSSDSVKQNEKDFSGKMQQRKSTAQPAP